MEYRAPRDDSSYRREDGLDTQKNPSDRINIPLTKGIQRRVSKEKTRNALTRPQHKTPRLAPPKASFFDDIYTQETSMHTDLHTHLLFFCTALLCTATLGSCSSNDPSTRAQNTSRPQTPAANTPETSSQDLTAFWAWWSDGKAELNGYDLIQPRYGQDRHGRAVMVFVTEPFSRSKKVKVDRYDNNDPDHFTALKLNHVRKFQTGIYDYSVMTSVFVDPATSFNAVKATFSMQEWCGHVFENADFDATQTKLNVNSYFEGETNTKNLTSSEGPILPEDAVWITLRQLASRSFTTPSSSTPTMLPSATLRRMKHLDASLYTGSVQWDDTTQQTEVPAGTFTTHAATWTRQDSSTCTAQIEDPYPHRIISWQCTDGEKGSLTGSQRLAYWGTHNLGDESYLEPLGLRPLRVEP